MVGLKTKTCVSQKRAGKAWQIPSCLVHNQGWPEPYIYTVYDRISGNFPAKNTVYAPYIYGPGQTLPIRYGGLKEHRR